MSQPIYTVNMGVGQLCVALTLAENTQRTASRSKCSVISASRLLYKHVKHLDQSLRRSLKIDNSNCDEKSLIRNDYVQVSLIVTDAKGISDEYFILHGCPDGECAGIVFHQNRIIGYIGETIEGHLRRDFSQIVKWYESEEIGSGVKFVEYLEELGFLK